MADYKKNYLNNVIVRIDFNAIELSDVRSYLSSIKERFPDQKKEVGNQSEINFAVNEGVPKTTAKNVTFDVWKLADANQTVSCTLTPTFLVIEYKKYSNTKQLLLDIELVFDSFLQKYEIPIINRIGMLYSNVIDVGEKTNPTDWRLYINKALLSGIEFAKENNLELSRCMGQIFKHGDTNDIRFDYGIWNKDFPNQIARKEFVLEFDCFSRNPVETKDIKLSELLMEYNSQIDDLFEAAITQELRKRMS